MKTPIIIALSIAGVLGTAGAAMAVNAGTLAGFPQSNLGNAPTSLTTATAEPGDDPTGTATPTPEPSESTEPSEPAEHTGSSTGGTTGTESGDDSGEHSTAPSPTPTHHESDDGSGGSDD